MCIWFNEIKYRLNTITEDVLNARDELLWIGTASVAADGGFDGRLLAGGKEAHMGCETHHAAAAHVDLMEGADSVLLGTASAVRHLSRALSRLAIAVDTAENAEVQQQLLHLLEHLCLLYTSP